MAPGTVLAQKTTIDLIDLIVLIHNGPRCELNQLNHLNQKCFCAKTVPGAIVN